MLIIFIWDKLVYCFLVFRMLVVNSGNIRIIFKWNGDIIKIGTVINDIVLLFFY